MNIPGEEGTQSEKPPLQPPANVAYVHSPGLPRLLADLGLSLLLTSYQSGKVMIARAKGERINLLIRSFPHPMGASYCEGQLAISERNRIWVFDNAPNTGAAAAPEESHDAYFMPSHAYVTGDVACHELGLMDDGIIFTNTNFSCLARVSQDYSFEPLWQPAFISSLSPDDRCHLNGASFAGGQPRYVTALGASDAAQGWRPNRSTGGVLIDVASSEIIASELCMPHSPRLYGGELWVLNSGVGDLCLVDLSSGQISVIARLPGFTRGLAFEQDYAFVGLSKIREKRHFSGLPIEDEMDNLKCGVAVVHLETGKVAEFLEFTDGCEEVFEVVALAGLRWPNLIEPEADLVNSIFSLPPAG